jgi:hypothetical protein
MELFGIIIFLALFIGTVFILQIILKDPGFIFKSFIRYLKDGSTDQLKIASFLIWGPLWIIDKIFNFKWFIESFEEASIPVNIQFNEFSKYIIIHNCEIVEFENILKLFQSDFNIYGIKYKVCNNDFNLSDLKSKLLVHFYNKIEFPIMNSLIQYIENSAPKNKCYNVKGIFINQNNLEKSYFIFSDTKFSLKLIGKTFNNKKMYVDLDAELEEKELIFLNTNMDYFDNFNFEKFEDNVNKIKFMETEIKPGT